MKEGNNLVASLLHSCEVGTELNGQKIFIQEITNYPFDNTITIKIKLHQPITFYINIRKPSWATNISCMTAYQNMDEDIVIRKKWKDNDSFTVGLMPPFLLNSN